MAIMHVGTVNAVGKGVSIMILGPSSMINRNIICWAIRTMGGLGNEAKFFCPSLLEIS